MSLNIPSKKFVAGLALASGTLAGGISYALVPSMEVSEADQIERIENCAEELPSEEMVLAHVPNECGAYSFPFTKTVELVFDGETTDETTDYSYSIPDSESFRSIKLDSVKTDNEIREYSRDISIASGIMFTVLATAILSLDRKSRIRFNEYSS